MSFLTLDRNVLLLAIAQALSGANGTVIYATGAIIGHHLAPTPALATLPISIFVVGMALATLPVGMLTRRYGRRVAVLVGNLCGVLVGLVAALAIVIHSFSLFCFAMLFGGAYAAVVLTFRFAAAECVSAKERARVLSTVLAGGIFAGILGAQLVTSTMHLWSPHAYAVTYLMSAGVAVLAAVVLMGVRFAQYQNAGAPQTGGRPTALILRQPGFIVAMLCGVVSYMTMNFMMTAAPLAMELCGIAREHANHGIEMHIIAMYAPSFFTGSLISRFGSSRIIMAGLVLLGLAALVSLNGMTVNHFWVALVLLGVGWNFGFLGASAMVLSCHTPEEGPRVQSINDFVVFGTMVIGSFASGGVLASQGWFLVSALLIPPLVIAALGLIWFQRSKNLVRSNV